MKETPQEIFEKLGYLSNKYVLINFNAFVSYTPDGIKITCDDENDFWYHQLVGKCIDETDLKQTLLDTEWNQFFTDLKEGLYYFQLLLSVEWDGDDYNQWSYYVAEHGECEYICSLDEHLKQLEDFKTLTTEDLFSF